MKQTTSEPVAITPNFYRLGTVAFPAFLSLGKVGMIIEGGTGPTFETIVEQIKSLGVDMKMIEYILLTHTHADHIGAVPHLKRRWPHLKLVASGPGAKILNTRELYNEFLLVDLGIAQLMRARPEVSMMMWSGGSARSSRAWIVGRKSSATVQQMQPLASSTMSSSLQSS